MATSIICSLIRICQRCNLAFVVSALLLVLSPCALSINQDQLWLPRDYYRHFRALFDAAEMSEQTERCKYVIAGTLSQERSTKDHPVFVITCRDNERQTFAYIVDGLSLEILNRPAPPDPELLAQQELELKLEKQWLTCYEQLKLRTQKLRGLSGFSQNLPAYELDQDKNPLFMVDFNAAAEDGTALQFRAQCQFEGDKKRLAINRRIDFEDAEPKAVATEQTGVE